MPIPTTFEEYLAVNPKYTHKQCFLCLRRMGISPNWLDDVTQHCLMKLWERKTIERFELSRRNKGAGTDSKTTQRLFWSFVNLCIWRFASHWAYRFVGGFIRRGKDIKNSAGLISHNKDALDRATPPPNKKPYSRFGAGTFSWDECTAIQAIAEKDFHDAAKAKAWHDDLMRFREYLLTYKPKRKDPRLTTEVLVTTFDCMMEGCSGHEIAARLGLKTHQSADSRVEKVRKLMRRFFAQ